MPLLFGVRYINLRYFSKGRTFLQKIYSSQEKEYILSKINEKDLPRNLSTTHLKKVYQYVDKQKLNNLEELLSISGIGPKILRRICDGVLGVESDSDSPNHKRKIQNYITPSIDFINIKELKCLTAIHVGVESVSWALINSLNKSLLEWDLEEHSIEKGSLYNALILVDNVSPLIPVGDLYVMEEIGTGRNSMDYSRNLLTAMLSSSIQSKRGKPDSSILAFLKPAIKNKIYNASVGSERISLQNHVVSMINERSQTDCINFPGELKDRFFSLKPNQKEDMSQALLLATSFISVILNQRLINCS